MTDRLEDALGAFRGEHDRARGDVQATRRRLLRSLQRQERRRRLSIAALLVAALLATNSVTWAWSTGRLDELVGGSSESPESLPRSASSAVAAARVPEPPSARAAVVPSEPPPQENPLSAAAPLSARSERARPRAASLDAPSVEAPPVDAPPPVATGTPEERLSAALSELEPPPPPRAIDADRAAFAEAHRLHFGGGSPADALSAWDRYLTRFAAGRFVPEARFNRAVILLRLRRDGEARDALRPFAQGAYEGLRTREAQDLLDALDRGALRRDPP